MTQNNDSARSDGKARFLRVFTPFFVLLIGLLIANFVTENRHDSPIQGDLPKPDSGTLVQNPTITMPASSTPLVTANAATEPATVKPTVAIATANATLRPEHVAQLVGPPADSSFALASPVRFYWQAVTQPGEDEAYALYLVGDEMEMQVDLFEEPNLGGAYQAHLVAQESGLGVGRYHWEVRLVRAETGETLGLSQQRIINYIEAE